MMGDDAAQNLISLRQQQEQLEQQAQNYQVHMARLQGPPTQIDRTPPEEASAFNPEALATGVAASLILGPVGGALLGVAQGLMVKKEQQNMLDAAAADNELYRNADAIVTDQLNDMLTSATSPQDYDQIKTFKNRRDFYQELGKNPNYTEEALTGLNGVLQEIQGFQAQQERDAIEDRDFRKRVGDDIYNRYKEVKAPFDASTYDYIEQMRVTTLAREALTSGNPSDISAAITAFAKLGDPTTGVQGGEREGLQDIGPLYDRLTSSLQEWKDGRPMTVRQRNDMLQTVDLMGRTFQEAQERRQALAYTDLGAAGVYATDYPEKYDAFRVTDQVFMPKLELLPPDPDEIGSSLPSTLDNMQAESSMYLGDWYDEIKQDWEFMTNAADTAVFDAVDAARAAGEPLSDALKNELTKQRVRYETVKGLVVGPSKKPRTTN